MSGEGERIARLEQRADDGQIDHAQLVEKFDAMASDIHDIKEKLSNWRGFFSGMVFAISALAALIGAAVTTLWHRLSQ
jgi:uncharacterized BrkB/YihY/UPF0761 family membrane protein